MAINVSFQGATIYQPGAYSNTTISLNSAFPLGPAGLVFIFGEADGGAPGSAEPSIASNVFTAAQYPEIVAKYGSGNIVDACNFLFAPAADAAIQSGAQAVWIYKTNASTQASLVFPSSYLTAYTQEYGVGGNVITGQVVLSSEGVAEVTGTTLSFVTPSVYNGMSFTVIVNGGAANVVTLSSTPSLHNSITALAAEIDALITGFGLVCAASGSALEISMAAAPGQYALGWGRDFELIDSTTGDLAVLGLLAGIYTASVEPSANLTLSNSASTYMEESIVGGDVVIAIGSTTAAAAITIAPATVSSAALLHLIAGSTTTINLGQYATISQLVTAINLVPGWSAVIADTSLSQLSPSSLDAVTTVGAYSPDGKQPARIKNDAYQVVQAFTASQLAYIYSAIPVVGLPAALSQTTFAGGTLGGTASIDIINALVQAQKFHVNSIVPLFSRDATADIADGLTSPTSTYMIASIMQAVKTHISLMRTIKQKSERQGYLSFKASYAACKAQTGVMADFAEQLAIQDILQVNSQGNTLWFQPWAFACMLAGARGGAPVGTPLTFKYMNVSGIRQTAQPMTTPEALIVNDFDPALDADDAIIAGLTFMSAPQTGGFRVELDNTTYGVDDNFVYNRGNVLYAADILAYNFRSQLENIYVGKKNTVKAADIQATAASILNNFLAQGITVSTTDAPQGYKGLSVQLNGNTINIQVTVKIVEGIDFVLSQIVLQSATANS